MDDDQLLVVTQLLRKLHSSEYHVKEILLKLQSCNFKKNLKILRKFPNRAKVNRLAVYGNNLTNDEAIKLIQEEIEEGVKNNGEVLKDLYQTYLLKEIYYTTLIMIIPNYFLCSTKQKLDKLLYKRDRIQQAEFSKITTAVSKSQIAPKQESQGCFASNKFQLEKEINGVEKKYQLLDKMTNLIKKRNFVARQLYADVRLENYPAQLKEHARFDYFSEKDEDMFRELIRKEDICQKTKEAKSGLFSEEEEEFMLPILLRAHNMTAEEIKDNVDTFPEILANREQVGYLSALAHHDDSGFEKIYVPPELPASLNNIPHEPPTPYEANMYLAEDRIMCIELLTKRDNHWTMEYIKGATAATDVPVSVINLVNQRRRWLNGALLCSMYNLFYLDMHVVFGGN